MANYNSIPQQFNSVQPPLDVDFMGKVLMAKEGQTNANIAQIDETLGQLKIQENMLIGDQRKARFANNVQTLLDEVNKSGKLNLQSGDFTRRMKNYITTALDDYTLDHIAKANNIRAFYNTVAEKQKKGDGSYSTVNVNDALELAGANSYIKEESDNLGNLQYQDYVNVPEKLNKKADEYVKTMGIEKLLDSTTGEYYFSDVYGKRVTQDEIYNRISSELDEKDRAQLQINTRQSLGKMSPNDLELTVNPIITQKLTQTKEGRARLEAQIASETDKVKKDNLKLQLVNFDNKIDTYSKQLENKNYNLYSLYEEQLLNSVASNYDIEAITSIKRDNLPLEIKKFEFDQIAKQRDYDLKLREVEAKEAETQALTSPTMIEKPQVGENQKPSEQILSEAVVDADKALETYLKSSNENGYNQKSSAEQWAYKTALKTGDPTMTVEKQNLVKNFNTALEGKVKVINESKNLLKASTAEMYNNITGAKINNLATEMPYTTAMLKQGKKFEELDANQQSAVMLEMGSNVAKHMATGRERSILMSGLNALNAQLANHKSDKVQQIYNIAKNSFSRTEEAPAFTPVSTGKTGTVFLPTFLLSASPLQDTDVTELERYTGDANVDGVDVFSSMLTKMKEKAGEISDGYKSNLSSNKAMAWSTEDKGQKNDALRIQQAIQTQYPELKLPNTNNFIVSKKGDGFEVSFDVKNGTQTERVTQSLNTLSEDVMNKINLQEQKWHSNFNNPNLILPEFTFSPKMKNASYETFKSIAKNRPDIVPPDAYVALHNRGSLAGTEFQSDEDIMDWVQQQPTLTQDKQPIISNIINSTYTTKYEVFNGVLQGNIYVTTPDGKQDLIIMNSRQRELDEGKLYIETMQKVNEYKVRKITDILNGGNR